MRRLRGPLVGWIVARLARLRFPTLFLVSAGLFVVNLVVPDALPLADEILLGLATAMLASWRKTRRLDESADPAARSTPSN
jgi:hypothetical protein